MTETTDERISTLERDVERLQHLLAEVISGSFWLERWHELIETAESHDIGLAGVLERATPKSRSGMLLIEIGDADDFLLVGCRDGLIAFETAFLATFGVLPTYTFRLTEPKVAPF